MEVVHHAIISFVPIVLFGVGVKVAGFSYLEAIFALQQQATAVDCAEGPRYPLHLAYEQSLHVYFST